MLLGSFNTLRSLQVGACHRAQYPDGAEARDNKQLATQENPFNAIKAKAISITLPQKSSVKSS
jgi:hypothetical protein